MIYYRSLALLVFFAVTPFVSSAQDLGSPIGTLNTSIAEPSEASLQIRVDEIRGEKQLALQKYGASHPYISKVNVKLSIAEESLAKLKNRNAKVMQNEPAPKQPVQSNGAQNNDIVIQLQQMVLTLTNRVTKLEDEVRDLRATVLKLTASK